MFFRKKDNSKLSNKELQQVVNDHIEARIEALPIEEDPHKDRQAIDNIDKLIDIRNSLGHRIHVSADAVIGAVTNLTGILLVLNYEQLKVVTSKAFQMVRKLR